MPSGCFASLPFATGRACMGRQPKTTARAAVGVGLSPSTSQRGKERRWPVGCMHAGTLLAKSTEYVLYSIFRSLLPHPAWNPRDYEGSLFGSSPRCGRRSPESDAIPHPWRPPASKPNHLEYGVLRNP